MAMTGVCSAAIARPLIGTSNAMRAVHDNIEMASRSDAKVLIIGETGVGKEVVANAIHQRSHRHGRPFVAINCAGVPDSLLESEFFGHVRGSFTDAVRDSDGLLLQANKGTVFMDEIGEMSLRLQALLLRFLETGDIQVVGGGAARKAVDVRVIAATNRDLPSAVTKREFREDLYYRLNVLPVRIPPLRERSTDIPLLVDYYLGVFAKEHRRAKPAIAPAALELLVAFQWPGNVRQLRNVIERLVLQGQGETIEAANLPREMIVGSIGCDDPAARRSDPMRPHQIRVQDILQRLFVQRESFWTAVYRDYMMRDITRDDVRFIIRLGLERTHGSYRVLVTLFNMKPAEYKRFMGFLKQHDCHLAFQSFRNSGLHRDAQAPLFPHD